MTINPEILFPLNLPIDKLGLHDAFDETELRLGPGLDADYSASASGEVATLRSDRAGFEPCSRGTDAIDFGGRRLGHFRPAVIPISGDVTLTTAAHSGRLLYKKDASASLLTIEKTADPADGVTDGFTCTLLCTASAGGLTWSSSSLTNQNPGSHRRVIGGGTADLFVDGIDDLIFFFGSTSL